jgi:hypothetical protein
MFVFVNSAGCRVTPDSAANGAVAKEVKPNI